MLAVEVRECVSPLVHTLAEAAGEHDTSAAGTDLANLALQALELSCPIDDWEEAARDAGWTEPSADGRWPWQRTAAVAEREESDSPHVFAADAREAYELDGIDPHQREVYEHWAITGWFADKLEAKGEKVDRDFAGMIVWARTTTGQDISIDAVIQESLRNSWRSWCHEILGKMVRRRNPRACSGHGRADAVDRATFRRC